MVPGGHKGERISIPSGVAGVFESKGLHERIAGTDDGVVGNALGDECCRQGRGGRETRVDGEKRRCT